MHSTLVVRDFSVRYGSVTAVDQLSIEVESGRVVGLIGPNGAGKTSLIDGLTGFTRASGSVLLNGRELGRMPAHRRASFGLNRNWQSIELFDDLSVEENLRVAMLTGGGRQRLKASGLSTDAFASDCLQRVGLDVDPHVLPTQLSQGQRKLLGLARALASGPSILLADEPAAGLDTVESQSLAKRLRSIADSGIGIMLIDHDMGLILSLCDYVYVLDFGKLLAEGTAEDIRKDQRVIEAYLGSGAHEGGTEATA